MSTFYTIDDVWPGRLAVLARPRGHDWLDDDEDVVDGAYLYERNCSGCHGVNGAGDGETAKELGVFPRDFVEGGFSFGNTESTDRQACGCNS